MHVTAACTSSSVLPLPVWPTTSSTCPGRSAAKLRCAARRQHAAGAGKRRALAACKQAARGGAQRAGVHATHRSTTPTPVCMGIVKVRDSISAALSSLRKTTRTLARERRDSQSEMWQVATTALARRNAPRQEGKPLTQLRVVGVVPVRHGQRHVRREHCGHSARLLPTRRGAASRPTRVAAGRTCARSASAHGEGQQWQGRRAGKK